MDIIIFVIGLISLFRRDYHWTIAVIFILASNYLEFNTGSSTSMVLPNISVKDLGLLLYVIFFVESIITKGFYLSNPLQKSVLVFFIFLLISAIIDVLNGLEISDIIKVGREWLYFTFVWIKPFQTQEMSPINKVCINEVLKILLITTSIITFIVVFQNVTKFYFWGDVRGSRGISPPFYVMLFIPLLFYGALKCSKWIRWTLVIIMIIAIVLNLKQTYLVTVVLTLFAFLLMFRSKRISYLIRVCLLLFIFTVMLYNLNANLRERIDESLHFSNAVKNISAEDNFSFRLLLTLERVNYIKKDPLKIIRGIGFIHEEKVPYNLFEFGTYSVQNDRYGQTESADIAWAGLFMRLGLVGTFIFVIIYISIVINLYKQARESLISAVFCSFMIVVICFTSLGNAVISYGYFYLLPFLLIKSSQQKSFKQKVIQDESKNIFSNS